MIKSINQIADSDDATMMFFRAYYKRMEEIERQNNLDEIESRILESHDKQD